MQPIKTEVKKQVQGLASKHRIVKQTGYNCRVCNDSGWKQVVGGVVRCECFRKNKVHDKINALPEKLRDKMFNNYLTTQYVQADRSILVLPRDIKHKPHDSFFICGDYGRGKTHLLSAQYLALTNSNDFRTIFIREIELIRDMQDQLYSKKKDDNGYIPKISIEGLISHGYLHFFIDDLGKTKITEDRLTQIYNLVDLIYIKQFHLSISSNFTLVQLEDRWADVDEFTGGGIIRRIREICQTIEMY